VWHCRGKAGWAWLCRYGSGLPCQVSWFYYDTPGAAADDARQHLRDFHPGGAS